MAAFRVLNEGALLRAALSSDLQKMRAAKNVEAIIMQTHPQTQATFTMPAKPHRFVASDRVEGTLVCRSDGTEIGSIERLMIDKVSGKVAYAVLGFGGFMRIGVKHLPIAWDRMKYAVAQDAFEISLSDEELSRAPLFEGDEEFDWGYRDDVIGDLNFYRTPPY